MRTTLTLIATTFSLLAGTAIAAPPEVPPELQAWVPWALGGHEELLCPTLGEGQANRCAWPGALQLEVRGKTLSFSLSWDVYGTEQNVTLPGSAHAWPRNVKDGSGSALLVRAANGTPTARLAPGRHVLRGDITLETLGELKVPTTVGIVAVREAGKNLAVRHDDDGTARWGSEESALQDERFSVRVFRKFTDGIPGELSTRAVLDVSGKAREVVLGRALSAEFSPVRLESDLPASLDADGRLHVQVRPGTHTIGLTAVTRAALSELRRPKADGHWPSVEVWSFEGRPAHRVVVVGGAAAVDPAQSDVPVEWRSLSAYPLSDGVSLQLALLPADAEQGAAWALKRRVWQDLDGHGFTFQDQLRGTVSAPERLALDTPLSLKELRVQGTPEWLVLAPGASVRVPPRDGETQVSAVGRIEAAALTMPASGWAGRIKDASTSLYLRPGSTVFHVAGVDHVSDTWVQRWDLLRAFLLTMVVASALRLRGKSAAVALGAACVLLLPEVPSLVGFALVAAVLAWVVSALGERKHMLIAVLRGVHALIAAGVLMALLVVGAKEIRHVLHPTLGEDHVSLGFGMDRRVDEKVALNLEDTDGYASENKGGAAVTLGAQDMQQVPQASPVPPTQTAAPEPNAYAEDSTSRRSRLQDARSFGAIGLLNSDAAPRKSANYNNWTQDPNAVVQAGPGLPAWRANSPLVFGWTGTVERARRAHVFAVGPLGTSLFGAMRIVALIALALWVFPRRFAAALPAVWRARSLGLLPLGVVFAMVMAPELAKADLPSKELIDELRERISASSAKASSDTDSALVALNGDRLTLRLRVYATGATSVVLPQVSPWTLVRVTLDGKPASALKTTQDGDPTSDDASDDIRSQVGLGAHDLVLEGLLQSGATSVEIGFGARAPHHVSIESPGWAVDGVAPSGHSASSVRLTRAVASSPPPSHGYDLAGSEWPSFRIERTLTMGLTWTLHTEVSRLSPGCAARFRMRAFPRETPLSSDAVTLTGDSIAMTVPSTGAATWDSLIPAEAGVLRLVGSGDGLSFETWKFVPAPQWDLVAKSMAASLAQKDAPYIYLPWPGQTLELEVRALLGAPGASLSIESSELRARPGASGTDFDLSLNLRTTRGASHVIDLPPGAEGVSVTVQGRDASASASSSVSGRSVHLVLTPGKSQYVVHFRTPQSWSPWWSAPTIDLHAPSTNARLVVEGVGQRWVFGAWGRGLAPIVLFLGILIGVSALAWALSKYRAVPLGPGHWALLLFGLVTSSAWGLAIVVGWLVATANLPRVYAVAGKWRRRLWLTGYAGLGLAMLANCMEALSKTFTGYPESYIEGVDCSSSSLAWYMDRVSAQLSEMGTLVSLPLWAYRLAMFAWALAVARLVVRIGLWVWSMVMPKEAPSAEPKEPATDDTPG